MKRVRHWWRPCSVLMKMPKTCPLLDEWIERIVIGPSRAKYAVILSELEWAQIVMPEQI